MHARLTNDWAADSEGNSLDEERIEANLNGVSQSEETEEVQEGQRAPASHLPQKTDEMVEQGPNEE